MDSHGMVMVMGVTGAGKSTLINLLKPGSVKIGHTLKSETKTSQAVQIDLDILRRRSITVVDTPGFDDTRRGFDSVFQDIMRYLTLQYALKIPLKGILYLHPITSNKFRGSDAASLEIFQLLCQGAATLDNVIFLTTGWNNIKTDELRVEALRREKELIQEFWKPMLDKGAHAMQFPSNREEANHIVLRLVSSKQDLVLGVQRELVDERRGLGDTEVGIWLKKLHVSVNEDIGQRAIEDAEQGRRKWRHKIHGPRAGIHIFFSLVSIVFTLINCLSAFGIV
ncbi:P-loop containing nucleoside triphosphate hydrolase protein [Cladorrhinum sp. PSN332]|nr:P-loop containing nucleoside triphosphate hydrolase protein [Cladorrhinum sp. PSN332]